MPELHSDVLGSSAVTKVTGDASREHAKACMGDINVFRQTGLFECTIVLNCFLGAFRN